jgi:excisionase family DNA binding protein
MRFLDIKGLCEYTTLSRANIYRRIKTGSIPHLKIGGRTLFDREEIDRWITGSGDNNLPTIQKV